MGDAYRYIISRAGVTQPTRLQIGRTCGPACLRRLLRVGQCQHRVAQGFLVAVPLSSCYPVWLRHNFTPPTSDPLQALWGERERDKLDTLYARLGIEPVPQNLCRGWVVLIGWDNRPSSIIQGASATVGLPAMLPQGEHLFLMALTRPVAPTCMGGPAWGTPGLPVLTPLPAEHVAGNLY